MSLSGFTYTMTRISIMRELKSLENELNKDPLMLSYFWDDLVEAGTTFVPKSGNFLFKTNTDIVDNLFKVGTNHGPFKDIYTNYITDKICREFWTTFIQQVRNQNIKRY